MRSAVFPSVLRLSRGVFEYLRWRKNSSEKRRHAAGAAGEACRCCSCCLIWRLALASCSLFALMFGLNRGSGRHGGSHGCSHRQRGNKEIKNGFKRQVNTVWFIQVTLNRHAECCGLSAGRRSSSLARCVCSWRSQTWLVTHVLLGGCFLFFSNKSLDWFVSLTMYRRLRGNVCDPHLFPSFIRYRRRQEYLLMWRWTETCLLVPGSQIQFLWWCGVNLK